MSRVTNERWATVEDVDYTKPYEIMCRECGNSLEHKNVIVWSGKMPMLSECTCDFGVAVRTRERNITPITKEI